MQLFPCEELPKNRNPMVWTLGLKEGAKCADCKWLTLNQRSRRYYKCKLRGVTNGPATDHGKYYDACGGYEALEEV